MGRRCVLVVTWRRAVGGGGAAEERVVRRKAERRMARSGIAQNSGEDGACRRGAY